MLKMEVTIWLNHFNIEESALQEEIPIFFMDMNNGLQDSKNLTMLKSEFLKIYHE